MSERELVELGRKAAALQGVTVKLVGRWLWAWGDTRPHAPALKALGFKWAPRKGKWYLPGCPRRNRKPMAYPAIVERYGEDEVAPGGGAR
jgi:hypothetical protein